MTTKERHAFYSPSAAAKNGVVKWRAPDGSIIECTAVLRDKAGSSYKLADKEYRGPVMKWISGELTI